MFRSSRVVSSRVFALAAAFSLASISSGAAAQVAPTGGDPTGATTTTTGATSTGTTTTTTTSTGTTTTTTTTTGTTTGGTSTGTTTTTGTSTGGTSTGGTSTGGTTSGGAAGTGSPGGVTSGGPAGGGTPWGGPDDFTAIPIIDRDMHPCDRPAPGILAPVDCSFADQLIVVEAIDEAGYIVWRARQLLDKVLDAPSDGIAEQRWQAYFNGYETTGTSLQNWFGDYTHERAVLVRAAFDDIWQKYLGPGASGYEVHCGCSAAFDASASAHHWLGSGPRMCESFFEGAWDPLERGALLVHELLHHTWVGGDLIMDTHYGFGCEWNDGAPKCYSQADSLTLAQESSWEAIHNNSNYEYMGWFWANRYLEGTCNNYSACSGRDLANPACQPVVDDPPSYPDCPDPKDPQSFGLEGCPCADVSVFSFWDAAEDGGYADGAGSFLQGGEKGQYCTEPGVVCDTLTKNGKKYPICRSCDDQAEIGCPCGSNDDCASGDNLYCAGSTAPGQYNPEGAGKCLPMDTEAVTNLPWFCLDNCAALDPYGTNGAACIYNQIDPSFGPATCVSLLGACDGGMPGQCEATGRVCKLDEDEDDVCVEECSESNWDCQALGFPDDFVCDALGDLEFTPGHCVPAGCVNSTSEYCDMYR